MTNKPATIQLSAEAAEELYQWLESEEAPDYWEYKGLSELQAALSAWRKYEG